jgi:hypothetical protein
MKIVTQKPFNSPVLSYEENVGGYWRQFISEILVRPEVKNIHSFEIMPLGKGTYIILVLANISTTKQWEEADPFLVENANEENEQVYVGYARVPAAKH